MSQYILYDLPSKEPTQSWSCNPWKARLALNYKQLDYKTIWIEYPDIEATLKDHVPPDPSGPPSYTIPTVKFPDGTYVMGSMDIARRLEKEHRTPSMHLDSPILQDVLKVGDKVMSSLRPNWMNGVYENILPDRSREYFLRTRSAKWGKPLGQLEAGNGGEEAWMEALPGIKQLGEIVKANGGPFVMGEEPSYADFVILGWLQILKLAEEDMHNRLITLEPALGKLYEASKPWLA